jgi:hypothetical protein
MNNVRFIITGMAPKDVRFNSGETLADLIARSHDIGLPLNRVSTWYANNQPVGDPRNTYLSAGMLIAGAPKLEGGSL